VLNTAGVSLSHFLLRGWLGSVAYGLSWVLVRVVVFYFWNVRLQTEFVFARRAPTHG
jgi:hypothetical protein